MRSMSFLVVGTLFLNAVMSSRSVSARALGGEGRGWNEFTGTSEAAAAIISVDGVDCGSAAVVPLQRLKGNRLILVIFRILFGALSGGASQVFGLCVLAHSEVVSLCCGAVHGHCAFDVFWGDLIVSV